MTNRHENFKPPNNVLIVEDDPDVRLITRLSINKIGGMNATEASSGKRAVELVEQNRFDLILLDVMMPEMDGPTTLSRIRNIDNGVDVPVIFLTAKALPKEIDRLLTFGVQGVITKPFDPMTLSQVVNDILAGPKT